MRKFSTLLVLLTLFSACSIAPSKIVYGQDACHYCQMTIVEKTHATELVTKKGRSYKYDAVECMLNDLEAKDNNDIALFLVTDFLNPTKLIDAKMATYLISPSIKSPMGANLSAFATKADTEKFVTSESDKLFSWQEIQLKNFK